MSLMLAEAAEAPAAVARQRAANRAGVAALADRLRAHRPRLVATVARGSSDNAATYARYLIETRLGVPTTSLAPSIPAVFGATLELADALVIAISQSGRSPDLLAAAAGARTAGGAVVALVNDQASPLAQQAEVTLPLHAGAERSVAATKSFIASLAGIADLVAAWTGDEHLAAALDRLPATLEAAWALDWSAAAASLARAEHLFVIGRGTGLAVAQEAALKFKETGGLHAEAFSAAEVRHGPMALVGAGFPVLAFLPADETRGSVEETLHTFRTAGASVWTVGGDGPGALPMVDTDPALLPIAQIQALYRLVEDVAKRRGHDPDTPPMLRKVTETL